MRGVNPGSRKPHTQAGRAVLGGLPPVNGRVRAAVEQKQHSLGRGRSSRRDGQHLSAINHLQPAATAFTCSTRVASATHPLSRLHAAAPAHALLNPRMARRPALPGMVRDAVSVGHMQHRCLQQNLLMQSVLTVCSACC